ncbi:hypothetical protein BDA99DRAFT_531886 [Phascolomyces articulosus]|uniref:Uncharacterized protein n=1 Tax=Phascolomyces articulosus TaxID=60185 RepID=A0AAD5KAX3_9FUNG|nr:hypothetical protein BDA99DRAFT_531886 [Phascolomyces articulosus]
MTFAEKDDDESTSHHHKKQPNSNSNLRHPLPHSKMLFSISSNNSTNSTADNQEKLSLCTDYNSHSRPYAKDPTSCTKYYKSFYPPGSGNKLDSYDMVWYQCSYDYMFDEHRGTCELRSKYSDECTIDGRGSDGTEKSSCNTLTIPLTILSSPIYYTASILGFWVSVIFSILFIS